MNFDLSRRRFLQGSSAVAAGALLVQEPLRTGLLPRSVPRRAPSTVTPIHGATVTPQVYGIKDWAEAAKMFNSYVGLPLATTIQKIYMFEGEYFTDPLPVRITSLAQTGCQFIITAYPSSSTDESAKLAAMLQLLNDNNIVYEIALVNEWNTKDRFVTPQDYLTYWTHYAPVVKAAGVPLTCLVCASSNKSAYAKIEPGFPTNPLPDRYWIDYYATAYYFGVRIGDKGGPLHQATQYGVPTGIAEFGVSAGHTTVPISVWNEFYPYLIQQKSRLELGALYWGSENHGNQVDVVTGPSDPKVAGIQKVMAALGS
jgi:hypothetical protein